MNNAAIKTGAPRLASLDAYRGFVMFLMMAEVLRFASVAAAVPDSAFWSFLTFHQTHADWVGCSLHDLIQPSFSFLVGVALPFSLAGRLALGDSIAAMTAHAVWRSLLLILLGVFLRSLGDPQTDWTFVDTLTQIGLGYPLLFLLGLRPARTHWIALALILAGCWLAWALYPLPGPDFDYAAAGVPADWPHHARGFAAHWNKNANLGAAFDQWFLNLFPRPAPFVANSGGYLTLNFIPTLGTMILGLIAGTWLKSSRGPKDKLQRFALTGLVCVALGLILHATGLNPIVKRIWTPAWTLFSGGLCFWLLAVFYVVIDVRQHRRWAFPLIVIGMNSIAAYVIAHLLEEPLANTFRTHLGAEAFEFLGTAYEPLLQGAAILAAFWLILLWMYRRKLFLKV